MAQDDHNPSSLTGNPYESPQDNPPEDGKTDDSTPVQRWPPQPNLPMALVWTIGLMVIQIVVGAVIGIGLLVIGATFYNEGPSPDGQLPPWMTNILIPIATLTTLASAIAVAALYYRGQTGRRIAWRFCSMTQLVIVLLSVIPMATVASEVVNWAAEFLPHFNAEVFLSFSQQPFLIVFLAACVLPGLGEEIFFRGFMHHGLSKRYGMALSILVTSLLFGIMHVDPVQSCGAAFLGLWLHYLVWHTESLAAPIILHILNNTLAFVSMRFADQLPVPGLNYSEPDTITHTPPLLLLAALAAVIPLAIAIWQSRTYWVLPDGTRWVSDFDEPSTPDKDLQARASHDNASILTWLAIAITFSLFLAAVLFASQSVSELTVERLLARHS